MRTLIAAAIAAALILLGGCRDTEQLPDAPTPTPVHTTLPPGFVG